MILYVEPADVVAHDEEDIGPEDNTAEPPRRKPDYCITLGITWAGLIALEIKNRVPALSFKSFGAFTAGAAERAKLVGDTGASGPENWIDAFAKGGDHILVTLHAISPEAMTAYSDRQLVPRDFAQAVVLLLAPLSRYHVEERAVHAPVEFVARAVRSSGHSRVERNAEKLIRPTMWPPTRSGIPI